VLVYTNDSTRVQYYYDLLAYYKGSLQLV